MANSDDNSGDEFPKRRTTNGSSSARSQQSKSILKNSYKKTEQSDEEEEQDFKSNRYGSDDMKRYNSPVNSSRSVSNKPPTGRLHPLSSSSNNRDSYDLLNNNKKSSDKNSLSKDFTKKSKSYKSDDEDNDDYKPKQKYNSKNSDSEENFDKKRYSYKNDSDDDNFKSKTKKNSARKDDSNSENEKYKRFERNDSDGEYKTKPTTPKKNSARKDDSNSDTERRIKFEKNDSDDEFPKSKISTKPIKSGRNDWDDEIGDKRNFKKEFDNDPYKLRQSLTTNKPSISNRINYDDDFTKTKESLKKTYDFDDDIYKLKQKPSLNRQFDEDFTTNKKLTDSLRLEQEVEKEYEKLYNSTRYDKFDTRISQDKKSPKGSLVNDPYDNFKATSLSHRNPSPLGSKTLSDLKDRGAIPLPAPPNRATSLDRVNSAYNTTGTGRYKYNSSSNLNNFETMSDKSTSSLNATNLSIREAKSRSFLVGSLSSAGGKGLLGAEELERHLLDRKARVLIVTYNMAEMKTIPDKLEELVLPDNIQTMPDIYAIGTQEFSLNAKDWEIKLQELIGPSHVKLSSFYHGSIGLNIFIKRDLIWFCSVVDTEAINLRNVKMPIRTKASILLSFQLFGTLMCFICSHFESGDDKLDLRIENYKTTVSNITLPKSIEIKNRQTKKPDNTDIIDHTSNFDCVFWFGDFNFRSKKEREKVENKVNHLKSTHSNNYEELLNHDELYHILNNIYNPISDKAFMHFVEPRIMFEPTYKYDLNSDNFDTSELCRIPSYCDRVLYRTKHKNTIACSHYDSVKEIKSSDHRPVYALLEVTIRPGVDKTPLSFGEFDRDVYIAGYKKRQMYRALDVGFTQNVSVKQKSKLRCPIQ